MQEDWTLRLPFRRQRLYETKGGYTAWETTVACTPCALRTRHSCCAMYRNSHWCRGAESSGWRHCYRIWTTW